MTNCTQTSTMKQFYISFGSAHVHNVNGKAFDQNCVCEISAPDHNSARKIAFEAFGKEWGTSYSNENLANILRYCSSGIVKLEG